MLPSPDLLPAPGILPSLIIRPSRRGSNAATSTKPAPGSPPSLSFIRGECTRVGSSVACPACRWGTASFRQVTVAARRAGAVARGVDLRHPAGQDAAVFRAGPTRF